MNSPQHTIPVFGLYGEALADPEVEAVHLEPIATRSRPNNWQIRPHRHDRMLQVLLVQQGHVHLQLDDREHTLEQCGVVVVPPGTVHSFSFSPDTAGFVLSIVSSVLLDGRTRAAIWLGQTTGLALPLEHDRARYINDAFRLLEQELHHPDRADSTALQALVNLVAIGIKRQFDNSIRVENTLHPTSGSEKFQELLDQHYASHWRVGDYATELHMSISSLNRHCRARSGMSARQLIQRRLLLEIKRRLIYTQEPLEQVAHRLGFRDASYFSRYFKRSTGSTPGDWRVKMSAGVAGAGQHPDKL